MKKKPMLAYPVNDKPVDYTGNVYMQPKLDGVRCTIQATVKRHLLTPDLNEIEIKAYSRTGKEWKNIDHILFNLYPWFCLNPDIILDGELYNHNFKDNFEQIISMVRKTKPTDEARAESAKNVQFHCYDIIDETKTFEERNKFITQVVPRNNFIYHVETLRVCDDEDSKYIIKIILNKVMKVLYYVLTMYINVVDLGLYVSLKIFMMMRLLLRVGLKVKVSVKVL